MKKVNYKEKGITLVALVITIIILLILTGVTINSALSENGLFKRAKTATEKYQESEKQEQTVLDEVAEEMDKISMDYNDYVGAYVNYKPTEGTCNISKETSGANENDKTSNDNIGTNEEQKFTTEELGWKIWDYDKYTKTVRLISAKPTTKLLTLRGVNGYNNGVWAINEICRECYGTGKRGVSVANLRRTDIQKVSTYDYTQYKHEPSVWTEGTEDKTDLIHFGESKTYNNGQANYPKMWGNYDSRWNYGYSEGAGQGSDNECEIWERENGYKTENGTSTGNNTTAFKQSYYWHDYKGKENEFINKEYYNLLFNNEEDVPIRNWIYWLACRGVNLSAGSCHFTQQSVRVVTDTEGSLVQGYQMFTMSDATEGEAHCALRPIVSINLITSGYSLEKVVSEDGSISFELKD